MAVNGDVSFYRLAAANDTESSVSDKVEFEGTASLPDNRSGIVSFDPVLGRHKPENPLPHANKADKPDTGFAGDTYTFELVFDEETGRAGAIAKFRDWLAGDQTVDGIFDEGSIGVRNNYRPEYNLHPNNNAGYKVVSFSIHQNLALQNFVYGTLILEFSGDPARLGVV